MVYFKEVLPNPIGKDADGEWIKLLNDGSHQVQLSGWSISDASGKSFTFGNTALSPRDSVVVKRSLSGISLNNDKEELILKDANGTRVDSMQYTGPVGDDEVIIAERYLKELHTETNPVGTMNNLAISGEAQIINSANLTPFVIAFSMALLSAAGVAGFTAKLLSKRD